MLSFVSFPSQILSLNLYQMVISIRSHPAPGCLLRFLRTCCSPGAAAAPPMKPPVTPSRLGSPPRADLQVPGDPKLLNFGRAQLGHRVLRNVWG